MSFAHRMFERRIWNWLNIGLVIIFLATTCISCGKTKKVIPSFDGRRAYDLLVKQCDFGPRNPGSEGHESAKEFLLEELKRWAPIVSEQKFEYSDEKSKTRINLSNIIASFYPKNKKRALLCAHWDTRPFADKDSNPQNRDKPIIGANDGASGVAVLLEIGRLISQVEPPRGIDIVFFDGEDFGKKEDLSDYFLGSQYFALSKQGKYKPEFGVLLDMVGDADLNIHPEQYSLNHFPKIVGKVWKAAFDVGSHQFKEGAKYKIRDDHLPLIDAGIPCIDVIDFDYPYWHTLEDTPDKCSPESLQAVGNVIIKLIYTD